MEHIRKMSGCCHTQSIKLQTILLAFLIRSNDGRLTCRVADEFESVHQRGCMQKRCIVGPFCDNFLLQLHYV